MKKEVKSMKKLTSILLSAIIMLTSVAGLNLTAYAGAYDTTATARDYVLGTTTTGFFSDNDKTDFLKVDVPQSGKINFTTEGSEGFEIYIYPSNDLSSNITYFYTDYNSNLGKAYDDTDSIYLVSGTYYFKVSGYSNNSYTISTTFTPANESFSESLDVNNDIIGNANPIALDTAYNGMLAKNDEVDFYLFTVPTGTQTINISADNYIYFSVYSTNGNRLAGEWYAYMNDSTGRADRSESVSLDAGTYCLKITRSSSGGFYSFSINSPHQHAYNYSYTVAPTYTTKGYDIFACSCGDSYATNYTPVKKLGKVKLNSVSSVKKKHSIIAKWNKKSHASGYQIYYSRNKNFKKTVAKVLVSGGKTTSYKGKNFTKGKTYYVKVRAYKNVDGKRVYGKWSVVKRVKCK